LPPDALILAQNAQKFIL